MKDRLFTIMLVLVVVTAIIWFICGIPDAQASTYHVAKYGDNDSSGLHWDGAWATVGKVNSTISAGDTVYFGEGTWYESTLTPPTGGNGDDPTAYTCSTSDTTSKWDPRIIAGKLLNGTWVQRGATNIYAHYKSMSTGSFTVTHNDSMLVPKDGIGSLVEGSCYEDAALDSVYVWCWGGTSPSAATMVCGTMHDYACSVPSQARVISFYGLHFSHGSDFTVCFNRSSEVKGPDSVTFSYCKLSHSGGTDGANTGCFHSKQGSQVAANFAEYNHFYRCIFGPGQATSGQVKVNLATTYGMAHSRFTECTFRNGGNGIYFKDQYGSALHYGLAVFRCKIYDCNNFAFLITSHAHSDTIAGCYIYDCNYGIGIWGSSTLPAPGGLQVLANTIAYISSAKGIYFWDSSTDNGVCFGTNNDVKYNIIYACTFGAQILTGIEDYAGQCTSFWTEMDWDSNYYYGNSASVKYMTDLHPDRLGTNTWIDWHDSCGLDQGGSNTTDPDFHDPGNRDFVRDTYTEFGDSIWISDYWVYIEGAWQIRDGGEAPPEGEAKYVPIWH